MTMDRRQFLLVVGATAAATAATAGCAPGADYTGDALARPDLLDVLGADHVRAIGKHYREATRDERHERTIRTAILDSRPFGARFLGVRSPSISELVRADFANGRTVVVDGWVLATTEARQCALFSLRSA